MNGQQTGTLVTVAVVAVTYAALLAAMFRYATTRTPAGIVRRLARTHRPLTLTVSKRHPVAWDPSRPIGRGLYAPGTATYELVAPTTVRVRFQPRSGAAVERSGEIPVAWLPDTPEMRHRRNVARVVIAVYVLLGAAAFWLTAMLTGGSAAIRARTGAVAALVAVSVSWLATHLLLITRQSHRKPAAESAAEIEESSPASPRSHHLIAWTAGAVLVAAAFAVAWHLGNTDQPDQMSWPTAFLSAGVFVLAGLALVTASAYHHTYIHQTDARRGPTKQ